MARAIMSRATDWTCRSCRAVLGQVRDGVLRPAVPVESVDGQGVPRVPCPTWGALSWVEARNWPYVAVLVA